MDNCNVLRIQCEYAIDAALHFLLRQQNPDGSFAMDNDPRFKIWETAIAMLALPDGPHFAPMRTRAADFLEVIRRNDGSYMHTTRPEALYDEENYCMETTATAIVALLREGRNVSSSVSFVLDKQLEDGSWDIGIKGIQPTLRRYVSVTGHALWAIASAGHSGAPLARGMRYISACRQDNSLWGSLLEGYDSPQYAAHVIAAALHLAGQSASPLFRDAMRATVNEQDDHGSWGVPSANRPSMELKTALALNTLLVSPVEAETASIRRGMSWLLAHQANDGRWSGGEFGPNEPHKCEDLFASAMAVRALVRYRAILEERLLAGYAVRISEAPNLRPSPRSVVNHTDRASSVERHLSLETDHMLSDPHQQSSFTGSRHYGIVVVGGGPAGVSFVRTLQNLGYRARILVVERASYPRDKVCGGALTYLSLPLVRDIFPELSGRFPTTSFTRHYRFYYPNGRFIAGADGQLDVVPRRSFDQCLWESIREAPVERLEATAVTALQFDGPRVAGVQLRKERTRMTVTADLVVGADGSTSVVGGATASFHSRSRGVAVRQYARGVPRTDHGLVFLIDPPGRGYAWFFPFDENDEHWANIGYFCRTGHGVAVKDRLARLCTHPVLRRYLGEGEILGVPVGFPLNLLPSRRTTLSLDRRPGGAGYLLLGDAAGLVQPFTGEGIAAALHSGKVAAELVASGLPEDQRLARYEQAVLEFARKSYPTVELFLTFRMPAVLPPVLRQVWMKLLPWWFGRGASTEQDRESASPRC